jgi:hypothetical protein
MTGRKEDMVEIKHACGHTTTDKVCFSSTAQRKRRIAAEALNPCYDCRAFLDDAKAAASGWPKMIGSSPRKKHWACCVRESFYGKRLALQAVLRDDPKEAELTRLVMSIDSANWWVDHRVELLAGKVPIAAIGVRLTGKYYA